MSDVTERERQLMNQNRKLKEEKLHLEVLYGQVEEEMDQKVKKMAAERKTHLEKIDSLQLKVYQQDEDIAELAQMVQKAAAEKPDEVAAKSMMSQSFFDDFEKLQDEADQLKDDKKSLQAKVRDLQDEIRRLLEMIEGLRSEGAELAEAVSSLKTSNTWLAKQNKELSENMRLIQGSMDYGLKPNQEHAAKSLFEEIREIQEIADLKEEVDTLTKLNQKLLQENAELRQEVAVLKKTMTSSCRQPIQKRILVPELSAEILSTPKAAERQPIHKRKLVLERSRSTTPSRMSERSATPSRMTEKSATSSRMTEKSATSSRITTIVPELPQKGGRRELEHLKSHYDPSTGTYDLAYGELPEKAAKLLTPSKGSKILKSILRSPSPFR